MKAILNKRCYLNKELYIGLFAICIGVFLLLVRDRNTGIYRIYPRFLFCSLILLGTVMMLRAVLSPGQEDILKIKISLFEAALLVLLLLVRPLGNLLGLYSTFFIICTSISIMIQKERSVKKAAGAAAFNMALMAVLYVMFTVLLRVNMPKGLLF